MTKEQFVARCEQEFKEKEPENYKKVNRRGLISGILLVLILLLTMGGGTLGLIPCALMGIYGFSTLKLMKNYNQTLKKYLNNNEYEKYPVNYPYSFLYPGETYPFGSNVMATQPQMSPVQQSQVTPVNQLQNTSVQQPQVAPVQQPQVAQTAPVQAVVAKVEPTTKQIMCANCNQQLTIPVGNEPVMVTCPVCGNSFVHTPN